MIVLRAISVLVLLIAGSFILTLVIKTLLHFPQPITMIINFLFGFWIGFISTPWILEGSK